MGTPTPRGGLGLSLYADLLDNIESSPSQQSTTKESQPPKNENVKPSPLNPGMHGDFKGPANKYKTNPFGHSALRFQPIIRAQAKKANQPKKTIPKAFTAVPPVTSASANATTLSATAANPAASAATPHRSTLADWTATAEEDEYLYGSGGGQYRERGGRRKKKKKAQDVPVETNWDEIYDPSRPTNLDEYLQGEDYLQSEREWKDILYAHRRKRRSSSRSYGYSRDNSDDEGYDRRPAEGEFISTRSIEIKFKWVC